MSENLNKIKPFKQIPSCDENTILSILPSEFEAIQSLLNAFKAPIAALDNIFNRNLNEGKIYIKYIQEDGTEISKEEAAEFLKKAKDYIEEQNKK